MAISRSLSQVYAANPVTGLKTNDLFYTSVSGTTDAGITFGYLVNSIGSNLSGTLNVNISGGLANTPAFSLVANPTNAAGVSGAVTLGNGLAFVNGMLTASGSGGTVMSITAGSGLTGGTITGTGTISVGTNAITYPMLQKVSSMSLLGNPSNAQANIAEIAVGAGLLLTGNTLSVVVSNTGTINAGQQNQIAYYPTNGNMLKGLTSVNNAILVTDASGVPSLGTALPSAIQSAITTLGSITAGTWMGGVIAPTFGGTGINNGTNTLTLSGNTVFSGNYPVTIISTAITNVTLPSGSITLVPTSGLGAAGTWGISISGNAATATTAQLATNATNATNAQNATTANSAGTISNLTANTLFGNPTNLTSNGVPVALGPNFSFVSGALTYTPTQSGSVDAGTSGQLSYYALSGSELSPLGVGTNLSITNGILNAAVGIPMLQSGYIFVGNSAGNAMGVPLSGDASINNAGFITVNHATNSDIAANATLAATATLALNLKSLPASVLYGNAQTGVQNGEPIYIGSGLYFVNQTLNANVGISTTLPATQIYVGNNSNIATASFLSGDGSLDASGKLTVSHAATADTSTSCTTAASATLANNIASIPPVSLFGNSTNATTVGQPISIGAGLSFTGNVLNVMTTGGTVTSVSTGQGLTGGPITTSGTISIPNNGVTYALFQQAPTMTLLGNSAGVTGNIGPITLGPSLSIVNGVLTVMTTGGTVTSITAGAGLTGGTITSTGTIAIGANAVTYPLLQQASAAVLLGNPTNATSNVQEITVGSGLVFMNGVLNSVSTGSGTVLTGAKNSLNYYPMDGTATGPLATANNGVLVTSATGVPSISSALPSAVQSAITTLGTIVTGVWNGTVVSPTFGGTGVNNGSNTLTLAANVNFAGAFATTINSTAISSVTLPAGATTLVPTTGTGATGSWNISITGNAATSTTSTTANSATLAANLSNLPASTIYGNATNALSTGAPITLGPNLSFTGSVLNSLNSGGTITSITAGAGLTGGTITTAGTISVGTNAITYALFQQMPSATLLGNSSGALGNVGAVTVGAGLMFSNGVLTATGSGGSVTSISTGAGLTGGPITTTGTISIPANGVTLSLIQQIPTLTILGNSTGAPGNIQSLTLGSGVALSPAGVLSATGLGGTVTSITAGAGLTGGTITSTGTVAIGTNAVTYALLQQAGATKLIGNAASSTGNIGEIGLGTGLSITGTTLNVTFPNSTGTVNSGSAGQIAVYSQAGIALSGVSTIPAAVQSNITQVGVLTGGTWNAGLISGTYGGTGVNNGASTITVGGNVTVSGAFTTTLIVTANTSVTLPSSGTLVVTTGTNATGTWPISITGNAATATTATTANSSTTSSGLTGLAPSTIYGNAQTTAGPGQNIAVSSGLSLSTTGVLTATNTSMVNVGTANALAYYPTATNQLSPLPTAINAVLITNASGAPTLLTPSLIGSIFQAQNNAPPGFSAYALPTGALTTNSLLYASSTTAISQTAPMNSAVMISSSSGVPGFSNILPAVAVQGTITGSTAATGVVGQLKKSNVLMANAVPITQSGADLVLTSIVLDPGDWDVWGNVVITVAGGSVQTTFASINTVNTGRPDGSLVSVNYSNSLGTQGMSIVKQPFNVTVSTTIYLLYNVVYGSQPTTLSACGGVYARRMR